ncbi:oligosaccharide flippase family protein [Methylomonas sp. AM2-LC]|uniref:oligosaccharide flippase family protein n=1 Tax=Methylomonas sp. AM2-LC TaxID=3153301 RepID=UPI0032645F6B
MDNKTGFARRIMNAGSWSVIGYGAGQILRFGSNLILTRLLYPEAFGIMAIVQAIMFGLIMLSDFGITHCIIRRERELDPEFINTAWTFQIIQGFIIGAIFCVLPPFIASIYSEPLLAQIMPLVGVNAIVSGFNSTNTAILTRQVVIKKVVLFELFSAFISTIIMIVLAWFEQSVWSLVWGGVLGSLFKMITSHTMLEGIRHRIYWDKKSVKELVDFGKWIIIRSCLTFVDGEGNKLIMGGFLGVKILSFFNLANTINMMTWQLVQAVSGRVLISVYAEVLRERPERIQSVLTKCRLVFISLVWSIALFFIFFGNKLMSFLYDQRYVESGKILQMLALGSLLGILSGSYTHLLTAMGKIRASTILLVIKILIQLMTILSGYYLFGELGVVLGVAVAEWFYYPFNTYYYAKIGFWQPRIDIPFLTLSIIVVYFTFANTDIFTLVKAEGSHDINIWQFFTYCHELILEKYEYIFKK